MGAALVPQAGVALGMALIAGGVLPQMKDILLTTVIGTTIVFELVGPISRANGARRRWRTRANKLQHIMKRLRRNQR